MIYPVTKYECKCDLCGKEFGEDAEITLSYPDTNCLQQDINDSGGWLTEGEKHYCPDCHSFDDEDNLVLKNKK